MKNELNGAGGHSPAEISQVVSRYRSGGLSLAEFARQERIPPGRLHYWIYGQQRDPARRVPRPGTSPLKFHEVRLAPPPDGPPPWVAEVSLPGGVGLRVSGKAAPEWIGAVVQALQRPC